MADSKHHGESSKHPPGDQRMPKVASEKNILPPEKVLEIQEEMDRQAVGNKKKCILQSVHNFFT